MIARIYVCCLCDRAKLSLVQIVTRCCGDDGDVGSVDNDWDTIKADDDYKWKLLMVAVADAISPSKCSR